MTNVVLTVNAETTECYKPGCYQSSPESVSYLEAVKSRINSPVDLQRSEDGFDIADGVSWTVPTPLARIPFYAFPNATSATEESWATNERSRRKNATVETHYALATAGASVIELIQTILGDDISVGIPANKMADCFEGILALLDRVIDGFSVPSSLRFVGKEDALLSGSYHVPIMRMDLSDLLYYHRE